MKMSLHQAVARFLATPIATLFLLVMVTSSAFGQAETGQIIGKVLDPNGAAIAGATVTIKSLSTGAERTATANDEGAYIVTNLQPGQYEVTAQGGSFAAATMRVEVTTGGRLTVENKLGIQAVAGAVDVVAGEGGVQVNTTTQELSEVISGTQIRELPTITRNPYALVAISGNVSPGDPSGRGTGFAINGQRAASTNILLDGGENVDNFTAVVGQSIPLDAVGEFRIITSNFSAEYGRASGGIVNVSTRPGTNEFHGSLYAFNRISRLASHDFDNKARGLPKDLFVRNQFGYALGGPVILPRFGEGGPSTINLKNKLFFFHSTEWTRVRSSTNLVRWVPAGELIAAVHPRTQAIFASQSLAATPSGRIATIGDLCDFDGTGPDSGIVAAGGPFCAIPINTPALREVRQTIPATAGAGDPQNTYQTTTRIDWNLSNDTQIYGRYAIENQLFFDGSVGNSPFAGFNTGATAFNQNAILNITHSLSSNFVSQTKLVFNRLNGAQPLSDAPVQPTFYLRANLVSTFDNTRIALPGYLPFSPGSAIPFGGPQNVGQLYEDLSLTKGNHTFRFGGTYVYMQDNRTFGAYQNAVANFGSSSNTLAFNNFASGNLQSFQVAVDPQGNNFPGTFVTLPVSQPSFSRSNRYNEFALYFNDSFRVSPRVTLNLGVRYEYYGVQHNKDPEIESNFYFGAGSTLQDRIRTGRTFDIKDSPVGALWNRDLNNFAPRLGFAWDIGGDGKMSIRGGYGLAYERNFGNVTFNVIQNPPNYAVVTVTAGDPGFATIPVSPNNLGPLSGASGQARLPGRFNVRHVNENIRNAYAHFWSAAFEREIAPRTVASVEYSGSAGRSLYDLTNPNRPGVAAHFGGPGLGCVGLAGSCDPANPLSLLNTQFFPLNTRGNLGRSLYHAMIASVESSNLGNLGLQFTSRYTFSRAQDNLSSTFSESTNSFNLGFLDAFDPDLDYGYADFDIRHRFVSSFNWDIGQPLGTNNHSNGFVKQALGGWTLTGIVNVRSGTPFSIFDCSLAFFSVCPRLVPTAGISNNVSSNPAESGQNSFTLIDLSGQTPGNYADPRTGTGEFGPFPANMTKRNQFRGPGFWNVDLGVYKNFHIGENKRLQFRGEFYNAFNHANMFVDGASAEVNETQVSGFKDGRRHVQLAIKFIF